MPMAPPLKSNNELASRYALQVAVETLKDRCLHLQDRLSASENENIKMRAKLQKMRHNGYIEKVSKDDEDINKLQDRVIDQIVEKEKLTQHIHLLTTENKHLWKKLSALNEASDSLGEQLDRIFSTLNEHNTNSKQTWKEEQYDVDNKILESMSTQLLVNMQERKNQLEEQWATVEELQDFANEFSAKQIDNSPKNDQKYSDTTDHLENCKCRLNLLVSKESDQNVFLANALHKLREKTHDPCEDAFDDLADNLNFTHIDPKVSDVSVCPICKENISLMNKSLVDHVIAHFPPAKIKDEDKFREFEID